MGGGDLMDVLTSGADWGWNAPPLLTLCWPCTLVDVLACLLRHTQACSAAPWLTSLLDAAYSCQVALSLPLWSFLSLSILSSLCARHSQSPRSSRSRSLARGSGRCVDTRFSLISTLFSFLLVPLPVCGHVFARVPPMLDLQGPGPNGRRRLRSLPHPSPPPTSHPIPPTLPSHPSNP